MDLRKWGGPRKLWVEVPAGMPPDGKLRLREVGFSDGPVDLYISFEARNGFFRNELRIGLFMVALGAALIALFFWMGAGYPTMGLMLGLMGGYTAVTGHFPIRAYDNSWRDVVVVIVIVLVGLSFKAWLAVEFGVR